MRQNTPFKNLGKSAKTHAGSVFVTRDLDLWPFDPEINGFPELLDRGTFPCQNWWSWLHRILWYRADKQTHIQTTVKTAPPWQPWARVTTIKTVSKLLVLTLGWRRHAQQSATGNDVLRCPKRYGFDLFESVRWQACRARLPARAFWEHWAKVG